MSNRREFLKTALIVSAGVTASSASMVFASTASLPKGLIYTKENPGKWAKKVGSHLPVASVNGNKIIVKTLHPMSEKHFIVRHTLVSENGDVLGEKTFSPSDKRPISVFNKPSDETVLYVTSFCNKHDFWVSEVHL